MTDSLPIGESVGANNHSPLQKLPSAVNRQESLVSVPGYFLKSHSMKESMTETMMLVARGK